MSIYRCQILVFGAEFPTKSHNSFSSFIPGNCGISKYLKSIFSALDCTIIDSTCYLWAFQLSVYDPYKMVETKIRRLFCPDFFKSKKLKGSC